jgi:hypothetical protein
VTAFIEFLLYWRACWRAYRSPEHFTYVAFGDGEVPTVAVLIGRNREAWRVGDVVTQMVGLAWKNL